MTLFADFDQTIRTASLYKTWRKQNPKEAASYDTYAASVLAGHPGVPPVLVTAFGRSLVLAARMGAALIPPPPPPVFRSAAAELIWQFGDK